MGHQLKLSIYTFSVKPRNQQDASFSSFEEFYRESFSQPGENKLLISKSDLMERFILKFIQTFNNAFVINTEETKGFTTDSIKAYPLEQYTDGMMKGGLTGVDQDIYDRLNTEEPEETIDKGKITSLPYYFKFWTPLDATIGVIMLQSYTDMSVNQLMINYLAKFIADHNFSMVKASFVPEEYIEKFKKRSKIWKLTFFKQGLGQGARTGLNPIFTEIKGMRVKLELSGFKLSPTDFWQQLTKGGKILNTDISALEMINDDDYEVVASYIDENGRKSQAKISKNLDILPTYYLPEGLKEDGKEFPNYYKIQDHTNKILSKIKIELGYTPENVD